MTRISHLTAGLVFLLMIIQSTYASFGLCIMQRIFNPGTKVVVGFQLFNDRGDGGSQYRSIYSPTKTDLQNNGWKIHLTFAGDDTITSASVSHSSYGNIGAMDKIYLICWADRSNSIYRVHYTCYDNTG
ncbi:hypothetical protein BGZ76_007723, partial [Entomortierella beljakovae]